MSTVNRKPIIEKIITKMNSSEVNFIISVLNTKDKKESVAFGSMPEHHDICMAVIQNKNYKPLAGVLWNTRDDNGNQIADDYYLIDLFNGEYTTYYHIVNDKFDRIHELITLLEVRYWIFYYQSQKKVTTVEYDDSIYGAPDSTKIDAFVRSLGFEEEDFPTIQVRIKSSGVLWTYVALPSPHWVGGGSDTVHPFTNLALGTILGREDDGYIEHLDGDPDGHAHVHGFDAVKEKAEGAMPKSGGTFTGDVNMGSHILNMGGASIKNVGAGNDDDAFSLKKGKQTFVQLFGGMSGITAYGRNNGTEVNLIVASDVQANSIAYRLATGVLKANAGVANDDVVNVLQLSTTLTNYLLKNTSTGVYNRVYGVDTTGLNKLMQIDNNFGISNNHNLADIEAIKTFVNSSISASAANYVTSDATGNNFPTRARLLSGPWFNKGVSYTPQTNDYAIVANDETHGNNQCRYSYDGTQWAYQYTLNVPFTAAQQAALDSGITSSLVSSYNAYATSKMEKNDGVGTGTTKLENLILSGDMTFQSGADVDFTGAGVDLGNNAVTATPTDSSHTKLVANKEYVDLKIVRKSGAPTSATAGELGQYYINSVDGKSYVCTKIDTTTTPITYTWILNEFVPLTGTVDNKPITGNLLFQVANKSATEPSADIVLGAKHNNMAIKIWGGTNYNNGSFIETYGEDAQVEWGGSLQQRHGWLVFGVPTLDGTGYTKEAILKPDGTFTFDGKNIIKVTGAGTYGNLVIATPSSGIAGWGYTDTLSNSIKLNGNEIIESLHGAGFVLTGKTNSSYISLLGGSSAGGTINLTGKDHSYKGAVEIIGDDGSYQTGLRVDANKGEVLQTRTYTNQSRDTIFNLCGSGEQVTLTRVEFTDDENPGSGAQYTCEIRNTSTSETSKFGYIIAKNRTGCYIADLNNNNWSNWKQLHSGVKDFDWTYLSIDTDNVSGGQWRICCKSGIVFIEAQAFTLKGHGTAGAVNNARIGLGIPAGYEPQGIEVRGVLSHNHGKELLQNCWISANANELWSFKRQSDYTQCRLFISYPVF